MYACENSANWCTKSSGCAACASRTVIVKAKIEGEGPSSELDSIRGGKSGILGDSWCDPEGGYRVEGLVFSPKSLSFKLDFTRGPRLILILVGLKYLSYQVYRVQRRIHEEGQSTNT